AVGEALIIGDARRRVHMEVGSRGRIAVGGYELDGSQRQPVHGINLDGVGHSTGRKAHADLVSRQWRQPALRTAGGQESARQESSDSAHRGPKQSDKEGVAPTTAAGKGDRD